MNKQLYLTPTTDVLVVRFEGNLCLSGGKAGDSGKAGAVWTQDDDYNDYGDL